MNHTEPTPGIAEAIKAARLRRGWSIEEMARRSGVSFGSLQRIEAGEVDPRASVLRKLGRVLGWSAQRIGRIIQGVQP